MNRRNSHGFLSALASFAILVAATAGLAQTDPLPSWNEGPAKKAIVEFVRATTDSSNTNFVRPEERIATFDQDGTLWVSHPLYAQAMFALDRVHALAPKHPRFERPYTDLVYQPMLELMRYLRASGYRTYIVTGGGQEFVRAYGERVYGVPPEHVIGSSTLTKFQVESGKPVLMREPKVFFIDDKGGKPVGIHLFIGRRPQAAFGNSMGDAEMLQWTKAGSGARLAMLVLHDDAKREFAYGPAAGLPETRVGAFPPALMDEAKKGGWIVISMKKDWKRIFSFDQPAAR